MSAAEKTTDEAGEQSWDLSFSAVELKESPSLGGDVRIDLAPRTTVLVGKNGAGKSLLLEKLHAALKRVTGVVEVAEPDPAKFACDVEPRREGSASEVHYECSWRPRNEEFEMRDTSALPTATEVDLEVEEACWISGDEIQPLWRVNDGVVTYNNGEHRVIAAGRTLLNWTLSRRGRTQQLMFAGMEHSPPPMAHSLTDLFFGVIRVPAGIPRGDSEREELALAYPKFIRSGDRFRGLAHRLVNWHEQDSDHFDEFVDLGGRIGLFDEVKVKLYRDPNTNRAAHRRDFATVLVDGTDFGLLSDGTLRVIEILVWLVLPEVKLLLIEEPETAVHPGLLSKLLAEIDAYSIDRQIVLTTQSPHVVSWADPRAIRLVERHSGKTSVRSLREDEIGRVSAYLNDEGTLGDFVYSGALDG